MPNTITVTVDNNGAVVGGIVGGSVTVLLILAVTAISILVIIALYSRGKLTQQG